MSEIEIINSIDKYKCELIGSSKILGAQAIINECSKLIFEEEIIEGKKNDKQYKITIIAQAIRKRVKNE